MSESKKPAGGSGEHPAVVAFRKKLDSLEEHELAAAAELAKRIERLVEKSDRPPPHDPRREDDNEIPVDQVDLPEKDKP